MEDMFEKLKEMVMISYKPRKCGWTSERSMGNFDDVFDDGFGCGESWLAYEIGCILGMELEKPDMPEDED